MTITQEENYEFMGSIGKIANGIGDFFKKKNNYSIRRTFNKSIIERDYNSALDLVLIHYTKHIFSKKDLEKVTSEFELRIK